MASENADVVTAREFVYESYIERVMPPRYETKLVWHYTNARGMLGILQDKSLWASSVLMMNDTAEITYGMRLIRRCWKEFGGEFDPEKLGLVDIWLDRTQTKLDTSELDDSYVFCASRDGEAQQQFLLYGSYAIGLNPIGRLQKELEPAAPALSTLPRSGSFDTGWRPVLYRLEKQRNHVRTLFGVLAQLAEIVESANDGTDAWNAAIECIIRAAVYMKEPAYAHEKEVRLYGRADMTSAKVYFHDGNFGIVPYIKIQADTNYPVNQGPLPIAEIHIGPRVESDTAEAGLRVALRKHHYGHIPISNVAGTRR